MSGKRKAAWLAAGKNRAPAEEEMPRITGDEEPDELEEALKGAVPGAQELSGEREEPMESCPDCERSRCFSCIGGKCVALTDNDFGHRGCPFFKPFEQARREQKTCFRRLVQRGRVDLIFKYRKGDGKERATDHPLYKMSWISSCTRIRKSRRWSRRCRGIY